MPRIISRFFLNFALIPTCSCCWNSGKIEMKKSNLSKELLAFSKRDFPRIIHFRYLMFIGREVISLMLMKEKIVPKLRTVLRKRNILLSPNRVQ